MNAAIGIATIPWTRLPLAFDAARMQAELATIPAESWVRHFNQRDYEGDWRTTALRSRTGHVMDVLPVGTVSEYRDTALMQSCPYLAEVVHSFACPMKSVRLLSLAAGALIKEHRDRDLVLKDGELRIHVPILTSADVEFVVANRRLMLREGESWYIDFTQPHRIENRGTQPRVHLVLDGEVNEWARDVLERAVREIDTETFDPSR